MKIRPLLIIGSASVVILASLFLSLSKSSDNLGISNNKISAQKVKEQEIKITPTVLDKTQDGLAEHQTFLQHALSLADTKTLKEADVEPIDSLDYEDPKVTEAVKDYEKLKPAYDEAKKKYNIAFEQYYKGEINQEELGEKNKILEQIRQKRLDKLKVVFAMYKLTEADRQNKILSKADSVMEKWNE